MDRINVEGMTFEGATVPLVSCPLLVIKGELGMLGCGYFNLAAAEKFGDALAIVSGVSNYDDMLKAEVKAVSSAAAKLGVTPGMSGLSALLSFHEKRK